MAGQAGGVTYREAGQDYFAKRTLRRHAGVWSLWALGVAAVISGEFSGWNLGLDAGGFGGLLVDALFGVNIAQPIWWLIFYAIFLALNLLGIEMAMRFTVGICSWHWRSWRCSASARSPNSTSPPTR